MRFLLLSFFTTVLVSVAGAQNYKTPEETVKVFFRGLNSSDTLLIKSTLHSGIVLQTVNRTNEVIEQPVSGFLRSVGRMPPGSIDERTGEMIIRTDAPLAQVSMSYELFINGKKLHGGTNFFTLAMEGGSYRILHIIDTRKP